MYEELDLVYWMTRLLRLLHSTIRNNYNNTITTTTTIAENPV